MRIKVSVVGERERSYDGKRGPVTLHLLTCLDSDNDYMMINTFDYQLTAAEFEARKGTMRGQTIELAVTSLEEDFGGRIVAKGQILTPAKVAPARAA